MTLKGISPVVGGTLGSALAVAFWSPVSYMFARVLPNASPKGAAAPIAIIDYAKTFPVELLILTLMQFVSTLLSVRILRINSPFQGALGGCVGTSMGYAVFRFIPRIGDLESIGDALRIFGGFAVITVICFWAIRRFSKCNSRPEKP